MRSARPVGLTEDGRSLIVETGDGEQIAIPADAELRRVLRGDRPRRPLEIEVESRLTPREIQMKIRAGASAEEIADASGMPIERVEAFAAPVIAERNHIAGLAQHGSVRRRGEPTGHRSLRLTVSERLRERGVDPDSVRWDAFKLDDGRWSISADYRLEQADREAVFYFDQRGRFSVAGNDEARWAIGDEIQPAPVTADPVATADIDTEPTLKLAGPAEELALLRSLETGRAEDADDDGAAEQAPIVRGGVDRAAAGQGDPGQRAGTADEPTTAELGTAEEPIPDEPSQIDLLYDLLGSETFAEESTRAYEGLSDAAAVPAVEEGSWQPAAEDQDYPAEPETEPEPQVFADGATQDALPGADQPATPDPEPVEGTAPSRPGTPGSDKPKKRKRASVPSWDEIMFGSPKRK